MQGKLYCTLELRWMQCKGNINSSGFSLKYTVIVVNICYEVKESNINILVITIKI